MTSTARRLVLDANEAVASVAYRLSETKTVSFTNFPAPNFGNPAQIKVEVQPVQNESNTNNNSATYPVIFST